MKLNGKYLLASLLIATYLSCGGDSSTEEEVSTLLIYRIDYTTLAFEGGVTLTPDKVPPPFFSQIPLDIDKEPANIDGNGAISIIYNPTLDQIFNAELTNNGESNIFFPSFIAPAEFFRLDEPLTFPSGATVQSIDGDHSQVDITPIWSAVSSLGLTEFALNENTLFGLYLYQPNADVAFSENWDWIFMVYSQ